MSIYLAFVTSLFLNTGKTQPTPKTLLDYVPQNHRIQLKSLKDTAVVIIDAQNEYFTGKLKLRGIGRSIRFSRKVLDWAREKKLPIFHIQHIGGENSMLFRKGSKNVDFIPSLGPVSGETVIQKTLPNSFAKTSLKNHLTTLKIKKIIFLGYMTHMCLSTTVRAALDLGFQSVVIEEATTTRDLPSTNQRSIVDANDLKSATLAALADRFALVTSYAQLVAR